ncbi:MAG: S4 domain-containing protein, partial [Candidatus Acidiferrum sp.]
MSMRQENDLSLAYRVASEHGGERLDRFLAAAASGLNLSRTRVKSLIEAGHASIDGAPAKDPSLLL